MKKINTNLKVFVLMILISVFGICSSIFMIDKYCVKDENVDIKNEIDIVVNIYNETEDANVEVIKKDDGDIDVIIKDKKINDDKHDYNETSLDPIQGRIDTESGLNIREESDIKSDKVGTYCYGETVEIIGEEGDWYITNEGFIYKEFVRII